MSKWKRKAGRRPRLVRVVDHREDLNRIRNIVDLLAGIGRRERKRHPWPPPLTGAARERVLAELKAKYQARRAARESST